MTDMRVDSPYVTNFVAGIGDIIRICRPLMYPYEKITITDGAGHEIVPDKLYTYNGFEILDKDLGRFVRHSDANGTRCVWYEHLKSGRQVIRYTANRSTAQTTFYAVIQGIVVHDHASVYQGGPAYATYYADVPEEES